MQCTHVAGRMYKRDMYPKSKTCIKAQYNLFTY